MHLTPLVRTGPLITRAPYRDTKDPCPVWDGETWQYGLAEDTMRDLEQMVEHLLKEKHDHAV